MMISYNWLHEYLPEKIEPQKLSKILTAIGLEVETMHPYEDIKGGLQGLVIGEILACEKHPDADKLSITKVNIGANEHLQIVCGASNVAQSQKVVVAMVGSTIYPSTGEPISIKKAKIRGVESYGMICAEDEIGLGNSHDGIMVLPNEVVVGASAEEYFKPYSDIIYEIGLTPNRMDAMSHIGVAKDVCAYLSHHITKDTKLISPFKNNFKVDHQGLQLKIEIENVQACHRYSGVSIADVTIADSPKWLQNKLKSIGLKPINNIVDITNFIVHETGQPLHAFDMDAIKGNKIIIKNELEGTTFVTLDEKERKLSAADLMICNAEEPMCIAGVYGGLQSGVTKNTKNIFLESAWFNPINIRKTFLRHDLRTDAAVRFEKGVDISNTVNVLKRAAMLIVEIAGGKIASDIHDIYPSPKEKTEVALKYHYLKKLSGKNYHGDTIKNILHSLGFELIKEGADEMRFAVPFSKPDITIPADIVEEIMRIDGLDNVEIPAMITIAPSIEMLSQENSYVEKIAAYLIGQGFSEIFTNSITNSTFFTENVLQHAVKMINNLSEELNILRPSMMETGLVTVSHNVNRKNTDLCFFEFGKTYNSFEKGKYEENKHLTLYITGNKTNVGWNCKEQKTDFYFLKSFVEKIIEQLGLKIDEYEQIHDDKLSTNVVAKINTKAVVNFGIINSTTLQKFDIKQPVFYADFYWDQILKMNKNVKIEFKELSKYHAVKRDLSILVNKDVKYEAIEKATQTAKVSKLKSMRLFDVFENEKLGVNKKSMAVNYTFLDEEKTLTDKEIDNMMQKIIASYEKELSAEIRK